MDEAITRGSGLDRLVHRVDHRPALDEHGFLQAGALLDPEANGLRRVSDLATAPHGFVLLGAGGLGKSTTLEALNAVRPSSHGVINAMLLGRDDLQVVLGRPGVGNSVYLDALDQAAIEDRTFMLRLEDFVKKHRICVPSLRLACRPAVWRASLAAVLRDADSDFTEFVLAPMHRDAAVAAVGQVLGSQTDGAAFVSALVDAGLGSLSASVGQLLTLARSWKDRGVIDRSGRAMELEIRKLLAETNQDVPFELAEPRRLTIARRLAGFTVFGRHRLLRVGLSAEQGLDLAELPDDPEPDRPADTIGTNAYREVAGSTLFDPSSAGTVSFRHQRYLDHLAGTYMAGRAADRAQVEGLLADLSTRTIAPSLIGVAAWIASVEPDLVLGLISQNAPELAAAASEADLGSTARAAVVASLIGSNDAPAAEPDWSVQPVALVHDNLTAQLLAACARERLSPEAHWWISRLAAAAPSRDLVPHLQTVAGDPSLPGYARRAASAALSVADDREALLPVRNLLAPENDADNEVLGAVIDAVYPDHLTTRDLLGALRPQQVNMIGGYRQTLTQLPDRIPSADLPAVLDWFSEGAPDDEDRTLQALLAGVIGKAWERSDDMRMLDALARALHDLVENHRGRMLRPRDYPWNDADDEERMRLVLAIADTPRAGPQTDYVLHVLQLLRPDDAPWLLESLPSMPSDRATALAPCIRQLLHSPDAELADRVLALTDDHPAFGPTEWLRRSVQLDDKRYAHERNLRSQHLEYVELEQRRDQDLLKHVAAAIADLSRTPTSWWEAVVCLHQLSGADATEALGHDITERTGCARLSPGQQIALLDGAVPYLRTHEPDAASWWALSTYGSDAARDWFGVQAMTTLLRHRPEELASLETATWTTWAPVIVSALTHSQDESRKLRRDLIGFVPEPARPALVTAALEHAQARARSATDRGVHPREVYETLAPELADDGIALLKSGTITGPIAVDLMSLLAQHAPPSPDLRQLYESLALAADDALRAAASELCGGLDPNGTMQGILTGDLVGVSLSAAARRIVPGQLDDDVLCDAARHMLESRPYEAEPALHSEGWWADRPCLDLRDALLDELVERARVDVLDVLAVRPGVDGRIVARRQRQAAARAAEAAVSAVEPKAILTVLEQGNTRLVRDGFGLVGALVALLDRLQHSLTHQGAHRDLWNADRPKSEDDITDWFQRRVMDLLPERVVPDRELQVQRRKNRGIGERADLTVTVGAYDRLIRTVVEAKTIGNDEVTTALQEQLVQRYLRPMELRHGIYLVYWLPPEQRPSSWNKSRGADPETFLRELREQSAVARATGFHVEPYLLDVSRP